MKFKKGYKYQLDKEYIQLHTGIMPIDIGRSGVNTHCLILALNGDLVIKKGYAWDGASGPTWDTDATYTPSLVHDAFAQLMRMGLVGFHNVDAANRLLDNMLKERGMWAPRRWWWRKGLYLTHGSFADSSNVKEVFDKF